MKKFLIYWLPVLLWMGLIFGLSHQSSLHVSDVQVYDFVLKKTAHVMVYATLTLLLWRAIHFTTEVFFVRSSLWAGLVAWLYAMSDEFHQRFIPGRYASVRDVLIDLAGICLALAVLWGFKYLGDRRMKTDNR